MEAGSAIALAIVLLAGGGSAGALMMTDGMDWAHNGMMGNGGGMMGGDDQDCPYHEDSDAGECFRGADVDPEECEEHSAEDCPYGGDGGYRRSGCCD
jgi:hypothetical protein